MSGFPTEIPGFGGATLAPRQNPSYRPGADFTTEDYYVFSRCDGKSTARDIVLMVGLGVEKGCAILGKLRKVGAVLLPGETPLTTRARESSRPPAPTTAAAAAAATAASAARVAEPERRRRPTEGVGRSADGTLRGRPLAAPLTAPGDPQRTRTPRRDSNLGELTAEETAAMAEVVALGEAEKLRIIELVRLSERGTLFELMGVDPKVDKRELKRAYFKLSKEFHPDRYYRKSIGSFGPWLIRIFESVSRAFEILNDERQRAHYQARLRGDTQPPPASAAAQSRAEHAAVLFDQACALEVRGELDEAMTVFATVLRTDPHPRYMRRAARCCLTAGALGIAEEYARMGAELRPTDAAYARVLAEVQRAAGKLERAEATLLAALELKTDNDVLVGELRADLAAVRAGRRS